MEKISWHSQTIESSLKELKTSLLGLSRSKAKKRLSIYGRNEIEVGKKRSVWRRWANQFNNILIYILLFSVLITGFLQQWVDSSVILGVVFLNALIGYFQETKAEKAIESLKKMMTLEVTVIRDGKRERIKAAELVPGDIVLLSAGDKVPADLRLLKSHNMEIDEAILTGESLPVDKSFERVSEDTRLSERSSMAYSGTLITTGNGIGLVVATGDQTEIGKISRMLKRGAEFSTPLLRQITRFGHWLALIILSISILIFLFGIFVRHYPVNEMFIAAIAIAVSLVPEGLPAIISIALAVGVTRMARRHAIIRRLASVETLSSVTVICTDKTGTLTKNELTIQSIYTADDSYDVTGIGYNDDGKIQQANGSADSNAALSLLIRAGALCNDAELNYENERWCLHGSPMDGALLSLGLKANIDLEIEKEEYPRTDIIPFDSQHKFMATLHHDHEGNSYTFLKGAPEKILMLCSHQLSNQDKVSIDIAYWLEKINELAENGMRVLALAYRKNEGEQNTLTFENIKSNFVFLGIVGIADPPREEVFDAVASCHRAGITVKMMTGDHRLTAQAVAKQVGIESNSVLSGENIDVMSDKQLENIVEDIDIYSRMVPEHKLRLIKALRAKQHIVAMTGDGVNDSPALESADIGIAMGIKGTEVTKEASEMILADDNFASIKEAVKEGRNVYKNLKKAILFILPSNAGEGFSVLFAILFGYLLPITPLQILWANMVTAVTLALALAFDPPEKTLMKEKPRDPNEPLLSHFLLWRIGFVSILYVSCMFGLFAYEMSHSANINLARTMVVNVLVLLEIVYLLNCRRINRSVLTIQGVFGSKAVLIASFFVVCFQLAFTYLPFMQFLFKTQAIHFKQWLMCIVLAILVFLIIEAEKAFLKFFSKKRSI